MDGICECGCGGKTNLAKKTITARGIFAGVPFRFLKGHWAKTEGSREATSTREYREAKSAHGGGYVTVRGLTRGKVHSLEHRLIAEEVLGYPLPVSAVVHHINENRSDNRPCNLVICQDVSYHRLLHVRIRAKKESGHADWRRCQICRQYDDPKNLYIPPRRGSIQHRSCGRAYQKRILERRENVARTENAVS